MLTQKTKEVRRRVDEVKWWLNFVRRAAAGLTKDFSCPAAWGCYADAAMIEMPDLKRPSTRRSVLLVVVLLLLCSCSKTRPDVFPAGSPMADSIRFQYAIYFLPRAPKDPESVLRDLLARKYSKLRLVKELPSAPGEMLVQARWEKGVQKEYAPPDQEKLRLWGFGKGLSAKQEQDLQRSEEAFILDFAHPKATVWTALRNANELVEEIARETNGLVWDEETRNVFSPDSWHQSRLSTWTSEIPDITTQLTIHVYQEDEYARAITLGMVKAGLPDVVIDRFPWSSDSQMGNVINVFAQSMVEGAVFPKSGKLKLNIGEIKNAALREKELKAIKPPGTSRACLSLKVGTWEEGDPKNRLLRLGFDEYPGPDIHAQQDTMINTLFGSSDSVHHVRHNQELLEASRKARAKLPELHKAFNEGLAPGEYIEVKAPFPTPNGDTEWMWVEVAKWKEGHIKGLLANDPFEIPNLHAGQVVEVKEEDIFDYIHQYADKHREGNTTGDILHKMESTASDKLSRPIEVEKPVVPSCD